MKKIILLVISAFLFIFTSCEKDNYDEPKSTLKGKVVYKGDVIAVKNNGVQFELWQDGFGKKGSIALNIAQNGSFSATLFSGQYKLVRKAGAPWLPQLNDTIIIDVKKNTEYNVEVMPYFMISKDSYQLSSGKLTATFTLDKILENANLDKVNIYFSKFLITDDRFKEGVSEIKVADIKLGQENTFTVDIPSNLLNESFLFVRVGAKATATSEYCYTQVQKIILK